MTVLLNEAIKPNLMQTIEGTPALVHCGPFANIAHGNSSILADYIGIKCTDYLITEAGFGADMGFEKFCDIKCRVERPQARPGCGGGHRARPQDALGALQDRGGKAARPRHHPGEYVRPGRRAVNLIAHIENVRRMGVPVVVAINAFPTDTEREWAFIEKVAREAGAVAAVPATHFTDGGAGAADLARRWWRPPSSPSDFHFLYPLEASIKEKITTIATQFYGARDVEYSEEADAKISPLHEDGLRQPADLHGQDPPFPLPRAEVEGSPHRLHLPRA